MAEHKAFAGLRNDVSPERMEAGDLVTADNVNIDPSGQLSRRDGLTEVVAGDFHSLWSEGDLCLMVGGTNLYRVQPGYTTEVLRSDLTAGAKMAYCRVDERTYYGNGRECGILENGSVRSWGLAAPTSQGTATATSGNLDAGTYQYAVTYLRDDGQESGTGLAGRVEVTDGGISFTNLPVSDDPNVVGKILYLTAANGIDLYEREILDNATTATTVTSAGDLSLPLQSQHLSPPPAGNLIAYWRGRMWVVDGNIAYPSEPHAYELFDLRHYIEFPGPVTLFAPVDDPAGGGIFIAAGKKTSFLGGLTPEEATFTPLLEYGAILGTLEYVEGTLFGDGALGGRKVPMWASTAGICIGFPDGSIRNLTEDRYTMDEEGEGCAVFMPDESRYVVVINH